VGKEYHGEIQLASKGQFYEGGIPNGILHVEPWGTKEERIILSANLPFEDKLDRIIKNCTDCPISPSELVNADRQHLLFYIRCLSYGGDYSFSFKCEECSEKSAGSLDLEKDLDVIYLDDSIILGKLGVSSLSDVIEPFTVDFDLLGKSCSWRMLRGKDEQEIDKYVRRVKKRSAKLGTTLDEEVEDLYRQAIRIVKIDDEPVSNIEDAIELINALKGKDVLALHRSIASLNIGIDPEIEIKCTNCGYLNEMALPRDKSFFRPE
jgi:hypothetical protein